MNAPIRVRASSLSGLFDCASRWEAIHILGMKTKTSMRAALGTAIHASTAKFDLSRMNGEGLTTEETAGVLVDSLKEQASEIAVDDDDLQPASAEKIGLKLHAMYCDEFSPKFDFAAVELETKPLEVECEGVTILLTGTLDRARVYRPRSENPGLGLSDVKTGKTAVQKGAAKTKGHAMQVGMYELLIEHSLGVPITEPAEIIGLKTAGNPEIATGRIENARKIVLGTADTMGALDYAAAILKAGLFTPNPSSNLCGEKYCPRYSTCPVRA